MLKNIYIAGGCRTPFGAFQGTLSTVPAAQLGATAIKGSLNRADIKPTDVDEVFMGNVIGAGLGQNIARQCSLGAGIGNEVGCTTINKVCGSSMRAIIHAAQAIQCGDMELAIAGGVESMSGAPYLLPKARSGFRMGHGQVIDSMVHDGLWDVYNDVHMGNCGDSCAADYHFSREQQDAFAIESFKRAIKARDEGISAALIEAVEVKGRKGSVTVDKDENPEKFVEEKIAALRPAFGKDGTVTAGNASSINDGAAACVVVGEDRLKALGIKPQARILGHVNVAMEPTQFTVAPIHAIRKLSDRLNLKLADVDLFEINEAFSVVAMAAIHDLKLDHAKVNVFGGAVSLGHPLGATGARITVTLAQALEVTKQRIGIAALCIGGGEASAIAIERVE
ncbi:MAG: acetyl-CoA acetyltransferase [Phycisphaerae bacterium]|nr:MAG: acetyl-CoA acetyltransferase [Phycisphaerae bacterium]